MEIKIDDFYFYPTHWSYTRTDGMFKETKEDKYRFMILKRALDEFRKITLSNDLTYKKEISPNIIYIEFENFALFLERDGQYGINIFYFLNDT